MSILLNPVDRYYMFTQWLILVRLVCRDTTQTYMTPPRGVGGRIHELIVRTWFGDGMYPSFQEWKFIRQHRGNLFVPSKLKSTMSFFFVVPEALPISFRYQLESLQHGCFNSIAQ